MELQMFRAGLDTVSEAEFDTPKLGRSIDLGHSAAWHALHIAEWLRFFPLQDLSPSYAYLGWENAPWLPPFLGQPSVAEAAPKVQVLAELDRVGAILIDHIRNLSDEQLGDMLKAPAAPTGERDRLTALSLQLRHMAYHRGQLKLSQKEQR